MKLIYSGAEIPSNRVILESSAATSVGVSVWGLIQRGLPKTKKYLLSNYFPESMEIYVYPGIPVGKEYSYEELEDFCVEYESFIADNLDRITLFTEVHHANLPDEFVAQQRQTAWADVPEEKFAVMYDGKDLESLATRYLNVVIPGHFLDENLTMESTLRRFAAQHGTRFHALGVAKPDLFRNSPFETASTLSWLSPMMRGETIVWDGTKLVRYPKRMKDQARSRYRVVYERAGLDFNKILDDDAVEVSKLAIWSYKQLEQWNDNLEGRVVTMDDTNPPALNAETPSTDVTKRGSDVRKLSPRNPAEIRTLPVVGVELSRVLEPDADGVQVVKDVPVLRANSTSLRACDTCVVKAVCPAFQPNSTCAFNLPVEIKTKEQLKGLVNSIVELQGQRVMFAKFAEDLNGGYPDPNVGIEIDRLFKILESIKKLDDSKEMIRMTVERQGSGGALSALFGDRAQVLNKLPNDGLNEAQTNAVIKDITKDLQ
jgi:hypothetical protein